jgi:predicted dehydrogenase
MHVALLGYGKSGQSLFKELIQNDYVDKISVFDPDPTSQIKDSFERTKAVNFYEEIFTLTQPIDLVVIATPDHLHFLDLFKCIESGIPTFVEKPLVTSRRDLEKIQVALSRSATYQMTCNFVLRTSSLFAAAKREYLQGNFGSQVFIEGKYLYGRWNKLIDGWRGHENYSVVLGGLIHLVDLSCYITGNFDHEVTIKLQRITAKEPRQINDFAHISMSSSKTGFFSLATDFSANVEHRRDLSIYGDLARLEVKGEKVDCSPELHLRLGGLSSAPGNKGALLSEFISYLGGTHFVDYNFPNIDEIFKVLDICLGKLPDNMS